MLSLFVSWILLGILFLIAEVFFLTGDFLALWISALITWFIVKFLNVVDYVNSLIWSSIVFLIISFIVWIVSKKILSELDKSSPKIPSTTAERIVWQDLIVQLVDGKKVVFFEGIYFPIINDSDVNIWDNVKVISFENNAVKVKKLM